MNDEELDNENDNSQNETNQLTQPPATSPTPQPGDISHLLAQNQNLKNAQADLNQSRVQDVTPDQLNQLGKNQNLDQWTRLFMNFAGATNRVNPEPYTKTVGIDTQQEAQRLALQNQLANQARQRAITEQQFGQNQIGLEKQFAPVPDNMLNQIDQIRKRAGLQPIDRSVPYTQGQLPQLLSLNNDALKADFQQKQLEVERERNKALQAEFATRGWKQDYLTGNWVNPGLGVTTPVGVTPPGALGQPPQGGSNPQQNNKNSINYNQLLQQAPKVARSDINGVQKDYQKNYGVPDEHYRQSMATLETTLNQAEHGNFKASAALPVLAARAFEGISGRLTNFDIKLSDHDKSYYQKLQSLLKVQAGQGSLTPEQGMQVRNLINDLKNVHDRTQNQVQNLYRSRVKSIVPNFSDDDYLFGAGANQIGEPNPQNQQSLGQTTPTGRKLSSVADILAEK